MDENKQVRMARDEVNTFPNRNLHKTRVECGIYDRAIGLKRPNIMSHRNNIKFRELPY